MPPRLPSLMAIHLISAHFAAGEIVYQLHDFAYYICLILDGFYACVGVPGRHGGRDAIPEQRSDSYFTTPAILGPKAVNSEHSYKAMKSKNVEAQATTVSGDLFPYRLFGPNSYMGDLECIASSTRKATTRCERSGKMLILKKKDLFEMIEEFPQFGEVWASSAWRRECLRKTALKKLRTPHNLRNFAGITIAIHLQRLFRERKAGNPAGSTLRQQRCTLAGIHALWSASSYHEFSHKELKRIASPAHAQSVLLRQVDKIQRSLDEMREEVKEVRVDMKGMKQAMQRQLPVNEFQELFGQPSQGPANGVPMQQCDTSGKKSL